MEIVAATEAAPLGVVTVVVSGVVTVDTVVVSVTVVVPGGRGVLATLSHS